MLGWNWDQMDLDGRIVRMVDLSLFFHGLGLERWGGVVLCFQLFEGGWACGEQGDEVYEWEHDGEPGQGERERWEAEDVGC
jgi:hypothetical protein